MKINKRNTVVLVVLILILCVLSFILGMYTLKNGTLRKIYDIFFALKNIELNNTSNINYSSLPKIDTLDLSLSKKKLTF